MDLKIAVITGTVFAAVLAAGAVAAPRGGTDPAPDETTDSGVIASSTSSVPESAGDTLHLDDDDDRQDDRENDDEDGDEEDDHDEEHDDDDDREDDD